jgi:hypothetical protein
MQKSVWLVAEFLRSAAPEYGTAVDIDVKLNESIDLLVDSKADPKERRDLISACRKHAAILRGQLRRYLAGLDEAANA